MWHLPTICSFVLFSFAPSGVIWVIFVHRVKIWHTDKQIPRNQYTHSKIVNSIVVVDQQPQARVYD